MTARPCVAEGRKVLLIGWDAADWRMLHPLIDAGKMPVFERFIESGVIGNLATLQPPLSPMLWTSIATGKRPFDHGVHGFSEPDPVSGGIRPVTNLSRSTKAVWNILNQSGKRSIVVGWWPSHPAEPIDGVMVSNRYQRATAPLDQPWPMQAGTVHPARLASLLEELRFHPGELEAQHILPFVPGAASAPADDRRLASLANILADTVSVHAAATALMQVEPWDFMAVYYDAIDHFGHTFMKYRPPRREWISEEDFELYKDVIEEAYRFHDTMLGTLLHLAGEDTTVVLISDHGFHPDHLRPESVPLEPTGPAAEHRSFGVFAASGPGLRRDERVYGASLLDICPTLLTLFGLPIGADMAGRPLLDLFETAPRVESIPSWDAVDGDAGTHPPDTQMSAEESEAAIEQLVALGYIDKPSDDRPTAVEETVRELRYNLAQAYVDAGRFGDAEAILEALRRRWPEEVRFGVKLAVCYRAIGRIPELRALVERLIATRREQAAVATAELARIRDEAFDENAELETDEQAASTAHEFRRLNAHANLNLFGLLQFEAYADFAESRYDMALAKLARIREAHGYRPETSVMEGEIYLRQRRWAEAEAAFVQALAPDPDLPTARLGLARACLGRRDFEAAAHEARTSIGLLFHQPRAHYLLGMAYYRSGQFDDALQAFAVAARQNPTYPAAHRMLRELYARHLDAPVEAARHHALAHSARERLRRFKAGEMTQPLPSTKASLASPMPGATEPSVGSGASAELIAGVPSERTITLVTGLPRSGTSMMMQMLAAGGLPVLTDGKREADESNPRGYFELEKTTRLHEDRSWLREAQGMAVKVVVQLLAALPPRDETGDPFQYCAIFMDRDLEEVLASQQRLLERNEKSAGTTDLRRVFSQQVDAVRSQLAERAIPMLVVPYADAVSEPAKVAASVSAFFGGALDIDKMAAAIDPALYRERRGD